ncbi:hypothetical protein AB0N21_34030 [Streptomyces sp. NPDC051080]|uniref:hypothetical protein n=1 Tax=Streptomyces sp. NPDC051080 TaxID=3157222 RepID=UPI00342803FA
MADSQMWATQACQPCSGGHGGELAEEAGQQRGGQMLFLSGTEVTHGTGELGNRAAGGAPNEAFQPEVGKPGGRRSTQRSGKVAPAGVDRRGDDVEQPLFQRPR